MQSKGFLTIEISQIQFMRVSLIEVFDEWGFVKGKHKTLILGPGLVAA